MSLSGFILKIRENVDFKRLLHDIKLAADLAGLEARIDSKVYERCSGVGVYTMGNIADTYEDIPEAQQGRMYIFSDSIDLHGFDHVKKDENLISVIVIESISNCKRILLDFLLEYFKLNQ